MPGGGIDNAGVLAGVPRKPREIVEGGVYHVYSRGNDQGRIYVDDADRLLYLRKLGKVVRSSQWECLAYCLMDNHLHLLLETPLPNLSRGMQRLQASYTQAFNARHKRSGHLFQGRFGAVRIETDEQLVAVARYIARNPVEAGLCTHPDDWPWSSCHANQGGRVPDWLDATHLLRDS